MKTTRAQRRAYLKILKKTDPAAYAEAKKEVQKVGKDLHRRNVSDRMRKEEEYNQAKAEKAEIEKEKWERVKKGEKYEDVVKDIKSRLAEEEIKEEQEETNE